MSGRKQMSVEVKIIILTLVKENISVREIAKRVKYDEASVRWFKKKYSQTGYLTRKPGSGKKRKLSDRVERVIKRLVLKNRFVSASKISLNCRNWIPWMWVFVLFKEELLKWGLVRWDRQKSLS
jgi:transposase